MPVLQRGQREIIDWKNPEYSEVYKERLIRLKLIRTDPKYLIAHRTFYKTHPIDFIQDWMTTYDPRVRKRSPIMPFILFFRQRQFINWLMDRVENIEDSVVTKSRDMGLTYLCMAFSLWLWSFQPGVKVGWGSHKEAKVDRLGDPDSIFEKARMILQYMPREMLPRGFDLKRDCPHLKIINRETGATITGESGDQIGRGGRSTIYFKDESAFYQRPDRIDAALSQNSDVKIDVSTSNGIGTLFYQKKQNPVYPVFRFHWSEDPRKSEAWYELQKLKLDPVILAREVDIDDSASVENVCIPGLWVQSSRYLAINHLPEDAKAYKPQGVAGLDVGGGRSRSVLLIRYGPIIYKVYAWTEPDTNETAHKAVELCIKHGIKILHYDSIGVGQGVMSVLRKAKKVKCHAVNVGVPPTNTIWPDDKRAVDKFANLKAEIWWIARERFRRTYQHFLWVKKKEGGQKFHPSDLVYMCNSDKLIEQLSIPRSFHNEAGKSIIESKDQLKIRGIASPDYAEAFVLSYNNKVKTVATSHMAV